jgi:FtsZ-interacting cell division protein ZipA
MDLFDFLAILIMLFAFAVPIMRGLWQRRQEKKHPELVAKRQQQAEEASRREYRQIYSAIYGEEREEEAPQEVIEVEEPPPPEPEPEVFSTVEERKFESEVAERALKSEVAARSLESAIEDRMIQPTTLRLDVVDQGEEESSPRVQVLLRQLDTPATMVILHEVLGRPRSLNSEIY